MFRYFPVILVLVIMMSSCGNQQKIIIMQDETFSYNVCIDYNGSNFEYTFSKEGEDFRFTPVNKTTPIIFSLIDEKRIVENNGIQYELNNDAVLTIPLIVANAVKCAIGAEIVADYNGAYNYYGSAQNGEYCLTVGSNGHLMCLKIESINLIAEFM